LEPLSPAGVCVAGLLTETSPGLRQQLSRGLWLESLGRVTYHQPGEPAIDLEPEVHADAIRITLPRLATWGILKVSPAAAAR